ncbi:MAG: hypothetical protein GTN78_00110 [Gemmatimonadales bacterium]|nr:hypothetical protein [Gemmatimonadales bacterium]
MLAYPEMCVACCGGGWWTDCPWSADCSLSYEDGEGASFLDGDVTIAKQRFSRHLGGVNIGFADGHAAWYPSQEACTQASDGELQGGNW